MIKFNGICYDNLEKGSKLLHNHYLQITFMRFWHFVIFSWEKLSAYKLVRPIPKLIPIAYKKYTNKLETNIQSVYCFY